MTTPEPTPPNPTDFGYSRSFPGLLLAPGGLRLVTEADAIREITGDAEEDVDE